MVLDKLRELFSGNQRSRSGDPHGIYIHVRCGKCDTPVRVRVDKRHDLRRDYDTNTYTVRKDVMDDRCYRRFHFTLGLDENYRITEREISGGEFITEEEYWELTRPEPDPASGA